MSLAENNPNESHKQGANNICQIVLNFVPLDTNTKWAKGPFCICAEGLGESNPCNG